MSSSMQKFINPITDKSLGDFAVLIKGYFSEFNIEPEFYRHDQDVTAPMKFYSPPRGGIWLAKLPKNKNAIGMAAVRPLANRTCELKRLYVVPEARNHGIGQALLDQVMAFAEEQEYREILLSTSPVQKPAIGLYEKNDFSYCARYNDDNRAGLFMSYRFQA